MLRIDWDTVGRIIKRVCDDELDPDRLNDLYDVGIDEVSWKRQHNYLTLVADHQRRQVVWGCEGKGAGRRRRSSSTSSTRRPRRQNPSAARAARAARARDHGPVRPLPDRPGRPRHPRRMARRRRGARARDLRARLQAARHLDGHDRRLRQVASASTRRRPRVCIDPYHVVQLANQALDEVRRAYWNELRSLGDQDAAKRFKDARWSLLKKPDKLTDTQAATLARLKAAGGEVWRAYTLKEAVRGIFEPGLSLEDVTILIDRLLSRLARSRLAPFVKLGKTIRKHRDGILDAIRLGINQGRTEALNNKVRLITRRAYGFHSAKAALALDHAHLRTRSPFTSPHELHALGIA